MKRYDTDDDSFDFSISSAHLHAYCYGEQLGSESAENHIPNIPARAENKVPKEIKEFLPRRIFCDQYWFVNNNRLPAKGGTWVGNYRYAFV